MPADRDIEHDRAAARPSRSLERPITAPEDDRLDRSVFIARLCNAVLDPETSKATGAIVGITGPWGSGKSSVLNLLDAYMREHHPEATVVRFDPWLISGRNDLVSEFIAELVAELKHKPDLKKILKAVTSKLVNYANALSPLADLVPYAGGALKGVIKAAKDRFDRNESLREQRRSLMDALAKMPAGIVVLIDELDRVEDTEIRTLAQVVRAVADFPGISYVLAYDAERVIRALAGNENAERGRAYLEKIVQLQIPLPILMDDEIHRLLEADLDLLSDGGLIPSKRTEIERYSELRNLLVPRLISTPRDAKRLTSAFSTLLHMLVGEVDWIDLFGFCALGVKAPLTVEQIKNDPDLVADDPTSFDEAIARTSDPKQRISQILDRINPETEGGEPARRLLMFLFPRLKDDQISRRYDRDYNPMSISRMRPLLTTLRLGLTPGFYSRTEITDLFSKEPPDISTFLRESHEQGRLGFFLLKLGDLRHELSGLYQHEFWRGVSEFLRKPDQEYIASYSSMREFAQEFGIIFLNLSRQEAHDVYLELVAQRDVELTSVLMRSHIFHHGLFGHRQSGRDRIFLDHSETEALAIEISAKYRNQHLSGRFLWGLWEWNSVYTMLDTGAWDEECGARLKEFLAEPRAVDALTLMLFGGAFFTGRDTLSKMINLDYYLERVDKRLSEGNLDASVRVALEKAKDPPFG
jgi:energy-coupling factor transporter ATP-binding protein EcfA2